MSDDEQVKRSRRAKRRAEQAQSGSSSADAPEAGETKAELGADVEAAASKEERGGTEEIRDRNRRLRAQAAERRRAQRNKERAAPAQGLAAGEMVDDALARSTQAAGRFFKRYFSVLQWLLVIGAVVGIGWQIYSYRHKRETGKVSDALIKAVQADLGRVGTEEGNEPKELKELVHPLPRFDTAQARTKAATQAYQEVAKSNGDSPLGTLAKLGLAGTHYDAGKYDEARKLYDEVKSSKLAEQDADVKARAAEGIGLALEAKGDKDGASKAFRELENSDLPGFAALGMYHQARVALARGERDKAKDLVKRLREKIEKLPAGEQPEYLKYASEQLLGILDPAELAKSNAGPQFSPEQLEALQKQISADPSKLDEVLKSLGKSAPPGPGPAAPAPAPAPEPVPTPETAPAPASSGQP